MRKLLLPLFLFVFWAGLSTPPLPSYSSNAQADVGAGFTSPPPKASPTLTTDQIESIKRGEEDLKKMEQLRLQVERKVKNQVQFFNQKASGYIYFTHDDVDLNNPLTGYKPWTGGWRSGITATLPCIAWRKARSGLYGTIDTQLVGNQNSSIPHAPLYVTWQIGLYAAWNNLELFFEHSCQHGNLNSAVFNVNQYNGGGLRLYLNRKR